MGISRSTFYDAPDAGAADVAAGLVAREVEPFGEQGEIAELDAGHGIHEFFQRRRIS